MRLMGDVDVGREGRAESGGLPGVWLQGRVCGALID